MSHSINALTNKQQIHPKVYFREYLQDPAEPRDVSSRDMSLNLEPELLENSYAMRLQLRHIAKVLRNRYI